MEPLLCIACLEKLSERIPRNQLDPYFWYNDECNEKFKNELRQLLGIKGFREVQ